MSMRSECNGYLGKANRVTLKKWFDVGHIDLFGCF